MRRSDIEEEQPSQDDDGFQEVANLQLGEYVQAGLKVRIGGKAPMAEMYCRITVTLDKLPKAPEMITEAMDQLFTQAQEKQLLGM